MNDQRDDERVPSVSESIAQLTSLTALWRGTRHSLVPILDGSPSRGVALLAHTDHAVSLTEAVLLLTNSAMHVQVAPLVRLTMECAITAAWFAVTPGSAESANLEGLRQRRNLRDDMRRLGSENKRARDNIDELIEEFQGADDAEARKFADRSRSIEGLGWVYAHYRLLSAYSHAGTPLMDHYIDATPVTPENSLGWRYSAARDFDEAPIALAIQCTMLHLALTAYDTISISHPMAARLVHLADQMGIVSKIHRRA